MKARLILLLCAVAVALGPGAAWAQLFSDDFDVDSTVNWTVNAPDPNVGPDTNADFFFDYSTVGIPPAPKSAETTRGIKLQANLTAGVFGGLSVSPTGQNFTGDYTLSFDVWSNYHGDPGAFVDPNDPNTGGLNLGGVGTTNLSTYGILSSGTAVNYPGTVDGVWFATTGDGGSSWDWRVYSPTWPISHQDGDPVYEDPNQSRNHTGALYQENFGHHAAPAAQLALFPQQTGMTRKGTAGMTWHEVEIEKSGSTVTWTMDGVKVATYNLDDLSDPNQWWEGLIDPNDPNTPPPREVGGGNILFGHSDFNSGTPPLPPADDNASLLLFTLVDNVRVDSAGPLLGDVVTDGVLDDADVTKFLDLMLNGPYQLEADMNQDTLVNGLDRQLFFDAVRAFNSGGTMAIPEPSTLVLLAAGMLLLAGVRLHHCRSG